MTQQALLKRIELPEKNMLDFLVSVLDSDPECIVLVDANARVLWLNNAYEAFLGVSSNEVQGKPVTEVIENTRLHIVVRTGVAEVGEVQTIRGRHAIVNRIPIFKNGECIGSVGKVIFKTSNEVSQLISKISVLEKEVNYYRRELNERFKSKWTFEYIISCSRAMDKVKSLAQKLAPVDVNILILGESGSGKELFAHSIHSASNRSSKPFVYINCAAIPENLMESELFGYESGAFTNAKRSGKSGKLEIANGGTVFLDEIGDMSPILQAKLLRFLQEGELEKVGSLKPVSVDVRVVSATNRDIKAMVREGTFRADLNYRLSGVVLEIPPLRDRPEDVPVLCEHFLNLVSKKWNVPIKKLEPEALELLTRYHWPGNVRELQHLLERLYCISECDTIPVWDLPSYVLGEQGSTTLVTGTLAVDGIDGRDAVNCSDPTLQNAKKDAERKLLAKTLKEVGGNKKKAAEVLGIHRTTLYYKLRQHNML